MVEARKGLQVKRWYRNEYICPNPESRCKQGAPSPDDAPEPTFLPQSYGQPRDLRVIGAKRIIISR